MMPQYKCGKKKRKKNVYLVAALFGKVSRISFILPYFDRTKLKKLH
jgi:hypothetical protein